MSILFYKKVTKLYLQNNKYMLNYIRGDIKMPYYKVLNNVIASTDYTAQQIIDECKKEGLKIDKAYMSKLRNNKVPPPSEEVSRTISKVCNVDERLLVLEGYIDKAPKEIKEAFFSIKYMTTIAALSMVENYIDENVLKEIETELNKEPLSDFIISLIDNGTKDFDISKDKFNVNSKDDKVTFSLREPIAIPIKDNAMFPTIPENSEIIINMQQEYEDGDIVAIKIKGNEETTTRTIMFKDNNQILLVPLNNQFKKETLSKDEIIILGKIVKVIKEI